MISIDLFKFDLLIYSSNNKDKLQSITDSFPMRCKYGYKLWVFVNQNIYAIFEVDTLKSCEFSNTLHI